MCEEINSWRVTTWDEYNEKRNVLKWNVISYKLKKMATLKCVCLFQFVDSLNLQIYKWIKSINITIITQITAIYKFTHICYLINFFWDCNIDVCTIYFYANQIIFLIHRLIKTKSITSIWFLYMTYKCVCVCWFVAEFCYIWTSFKIIIKISDAI